MELRGVGVGRGVAVGPIRRMPAALPQPTDTRPSRDPVAEFATVEAAMASVAAELAELGQAVGGAAHDVLEAAALMAQDPTLLDEVKRLIESGKTGERAVFEAFAAFQETLLGKGGTIAERAADLGDVSQRIIARLRGVAVPGVPRSETPFILVALDLAPADTASLDTDTVLALITRDGGPTSHTAILARSRSIPAIVGVTGVLDLAEGTVVIADAGSGTVTVSPTRAEAAAVAAVATGERRVAVGRTSARGIVTRRPIASGPATSASIPGGALQDGTKVPLLANLESPKDAATAVQLGAEGVGLFRTEFLFLDATVAPTVDDQRAQYTELLGHFPGKRVVVRALDAGADKPLNFLAGAREANPALGLRGLRALLANEQILRDQLTALAQAGATAEADLWVMAPMVSDSAETEYFVRLGRELGLRTVGVTAEVPSLALLADQVLQVADFVSIGTNDLTQYTLAADRMLGSVARFQDPWHPAVLRLVKLIGDAGTASGKTVGVCGEAAADPQLAVVLVGLGATTLSMTPTALADVRAELARHTLAEARSLAAKAIQAHTAAEARSVGTAS